MMRLLTLKSVNIVANLFFILNQVNCFSPKTTQQIIKRNFISERPTSKYDLLPLRLSAKSNDESRRKTRPQTKRVDRDWTYVEENGDIYKGKGSIEVKIFQPNNDIKGYVFFMHGFSQYTEAYCNILQKVADYANVAVFSVDTGITSRIVFGELLSKPFALIKDGNRAQFVLQRALSEDTKQCIHMLQDGKFDTILKSETNIDRKIPVGIAGHSMGGGLSFEVAAEFPQYINYIFAMAPLAGVPQFDPIQKGVQIQTVDNSMLLAGSWDFIAKSKNVEDIAMESNKNIKYSSIFLNIERGLHTGFEDELVITNIPLDRILGVLIDFGSTIDKLVLLVLVELLSVNTGQLECAELSMKFFFEKMAKGQSVTLEDAYNYLQDNIKTEQAKKFKMTYPCDYEQ